MALDIGIRNDIPLIAADSDLSNRFWTGKSMAGGTTYRSCIRKDHFLIRSYKIRIPRYNWQQNEKD